MADKKKKLPDAPKMPEKVKKMRSRLAKDADTTERPPKSAYKEMGYTDAELKEMGFREGGLVRMGTFKGVF